MFEATPSLGNFVGIFVTLLVLGLVVQYLCLPARCHTWGWWMTASFVIIPLAFVAASLIAAYPPLLLAALLIAAGISYWRKRH